MAYSKELADRLLVLLAGHDPVEKKMFGGIAFMVRGHMTVGVIDDYVMARVGPEAYESALKEKGVQATVGNFKPMNAFVWVEADQVTTDAALLRWVKAGLDFTAGLPKK